MPTALSCRKASETRQLTVKRIQISIIKKHVLTSASSIALLASVAFAAETRGAQVRALGQPIVGLPSANPVEVVPTAISPGFALDLQEEGLDALENPFGVIDRFGYLTDGTRTEPDENTYLVLDHNPGGPTDGFDYGRHFLFQGHENGGDLAYVTRINLDVAQPDHRVTLLMPPGEDGLTHYNSIDGSCWDPFANVLLFTEEAGTSGGVIEISADNDPASARTLYGSIGHGGYEGIHTEGKGNLLIIEDVGGALFGFAKTGLHYSDGDASAEGLLGRFVPSVRDARLFFTQQHGENNLCEVVVARPAEGQQQ